MNLKYMKVSLFEIIYKKKFTFSTIFKFFRCTCIVWYNLYERLSLINFQ